MGSKKRLTKCLTRARQGVFIRRGVFCSQCCWSPGLPSPNQISNTPLILAPYEIRAGRLLRWCPKTKH